MALSTTKQGNLIMAQAKVFVTTHKTANEQGASIGKWFDLDDYLSADDFYADAKTYAEEELHDFDPEIFLSDVETDDDLIRHYLKEEQLNNVLEMLNMDDDAVAVMNAYVNTHGIHYIENMTADKVADKAASLCQGQFSSKADFTRQMVSEDNDGFEELPNLVKNSIDYNAVWEGDYRHSYAFDEKSGYVFASV